MLVPRCLKHTLSELQLFKAIRIYMGGMNVCALFHMTQLIFRSKTKTTVGDQINTVSKINKHRKQ